jgi:ADP-ribose pyrophosphatase YjhB (NUDIX family)
MDGFKTNDIHLTSKVDRVRSMDNNIKDNLPSMVVCVGSVVVKDDQVLFIRQAAGHTLAGQWNIPWVFVNPGESPDAATTRETEEESEVQVEVKGLLGLQELRKKGGVALIFLCRHLEGTPKHDGGIETDGADFFPLLRWTPLMSPLNPGVIGLYAEY